MDTHSTYPAEVVQTAKDFFVRHIEQDLNFSNVHHNSVDKIMNNFCAVVYPDNRTAGWDELKEMQPGGARFALIERLREYAVNAPNGIELAARIIVEAKRDPEFKQFASDTGLLIAYSHVSKEKIEALSTDEKPLHPVPKSLEGQIEKRLNEICDRLELEQPSRVKPSVADCWLRC